MKRTYALLALGSLLSGVEARLLRWADSKREADWRPAQATIAVDQLLHGVSPKPTNAPRAPDAAPGPGLDRRASSDNTCGYVSGITASSLYCDPDNACYFNSALSAIGCCPDSVLSDTANQTGTTAACPVWTTCYDSTDSSKYSTVNGYTMYCGESAFPTCIKHIYRDPIWTGYTLWGCAQSEQTDYIYYTPTQLTSPSTTTPPTTSPTTTTTPTPSTTTPTPTPTIPGPSPTTTNPAPVTSGKSTPAGAIVGGVVGGVGGLALIGLAAFFLLRRKNSGSAPAAAATGLYSPSQGPPPPGPSPGGYYDPNQPPPQMAQQQGPYGYGAAAAAGFAPVVDPRASIAKPPYAVQQTEYNPHHHQFGSSPPGSPPPPPGSPPAPAYNGAPGAYGQQPHQAAAQYDPGYHNAPSPPLQQQEAQQPYGQQPGGHPTYQAVELDTQRSDGEVRELAA